MSYIPPDVIETARPYFDSLEAVNKNKRRKTAETDVYHTSTCAVNTNRIYIEKVHSMHTNRSNTEITVTVLYRNVNNYLGSNQSVVVKQPAASSNDSPRKRLLSTKSTQRILRRSRLNALNNAFRNTEMSKKRHTVKNHSTRQQPNQKELQKESAINTQIDQIDQITQSEDYKIAEAYDSGVQVDAQKLHFTESDGQLSNRIRTNSGPLPESCFTISYGAAPEATAKRLNQQLLEKQRLIEQITQRSQREKGKKSNGNRGQLQKQPHLQLLVQQLKLQQHLSLQQRQQQLERQQRHQEWNGQEQRAERRRQQVKHLQAELQAIKQQLQALEDQAKYDPPLIERKQQDHGRVRPSQGPEQPRCFPSTKVRESVTRIKGQLNDVLFLSRTLLWVLLCVTIRSMFKLYHRATHLPDLVQALIWLAVLGASIALGISKNMGEYLEELYRNPTRLFTPQQNKISKPWYHFT
ncbi:uncharacterized protein LOC115629169 [Scaptodrosophila lebanonensis]|uniref:Uncharacterized protein LOC115629169 n=1 Tax=Drosophila lebanonensis TaxID=7225 RepID=A0A6J2U2P5_DROLE|nr:uncharacterized protein LOC115629169 [Scaptodrosophila lebanonensis]